MPEVVTKQDLIETQMSDLYNVVSAVEELAASLREPQILPEECTSKFVKPSLDQFLTELPTRLSNISNRLSAAKTSIYEAVVANNITEGGSRN